MSIVVVGGHDRMHKQYKKICSEKGHQVKVYTQMPAKFDKVIGNPDRIVVFTRTVSHKMVITAVKEAKRKNIQIHRCQNSSASSLERLLSEIEN